jgi:PhzF family phenazine biosynthesis protein
MRVALKKWRQRVTLDQYDQRSTVRRHMQISVYDVFAETPYAGNQAAVVRADRSKLTDAQLVALAGELALAETASLSTRGNDLTLRFATANGIVNRCGHATLASVADHVLSAATTARAKQWSGRYRVGRFVAEWHARPVASSPRGHRHADGLDVAVAWPDRPQFVSALPARRVARALGLEVDDLEAEWPRCIYDSGNRNALVPVRSVRILTRAKPDWARLKDLFAQFKLTDLHVYCIEKRPRVSGFMRLRCRNVFPYGVLEETATGTASVALAAALIDHWSAFRGRRGADFAFAQGIGRRRGRLRVRFRVEGRDRAAIWLEGRVYRILTGELLSMPSREGR